MIPAIEVGPGSGDIRFTPFYGFYLPIYVLAVVSLALSAVARMSQPRASSEL